MANWKEIPGYEGLYLVSDDGDIVALPKIVRCGQKTIHRKAKPIKAQIRSGYEFVKLTNGAESKKYSVHRLVAEAFLPNPHNLPKVNHKDENPLNNNVGNLEWCTRQYNIAYSKNKAVVQIAKDGKESAFASIKAASDVTGISRRAISNALCGWSATAGGSQWKYSN